MKSTEIISLLTLGFLSLGVNMPILAQPSEPVSVEIVQNVRAVIEVTGDESTAGVSEALSTLTKQVELYRRMGVSMEELDLRAVFHGQAGYFLLTDAAYEDATGSPGRNPNKEIIRALVKSGVGIELCSQTMKKHRWTAADILPEVTVVESALTRLVDLQLEIMRT